MALNWNNSSKYYKNKGSIEHKLLRNIFIVVRKCHVISRSACICVSDFIFNCQIFLTYFFWNISKEKCLGLFLGINKWWISIKFLIENYKCNFLINKIQTIQNKKNFEQPSNSLKHWPGIYQLKDLGKYIV